MAKPLKIQCCLCTRVRVDKEKNQWDFEPHDYSFDYSHGYCNPCYEKTMKEVEEYMNI